MKLTLVKYLLNLISEYYNIPPEINVKTFEYFILSLSLDICNPMCTLGSEHVQI